MGTMRILGLLFCLFAAQVSFAAGPSFDELRGGIVHVGEASDLQNPRWLGTGFSVDQKCTFATAKHVLQGADHAKVVVRLQLPPNWALVRTLKARVLFLDESSD